MDAIVWLLILLASALLAYMVTTGERGARTWQPTTSVGIFLALFGMISNGLLIVWNQLLSPKLVDAFPSENALLLVGPLVIAALVVLVLDLLGTIDVMSKAMASMNRPNIGSGGASGGD